MRDRPHVCWVFLVAPTASHAPAFRRLGLTDAALLEVVSPETPLLTVDLDLYLVVAKSSTATLHPMTSAQPSRSRTRTASATPSRPQRRRDARPPVSAIARRSNFERRAGKLSGVRLLPARARQPSGCQRQHASRVARPLDKTTAPHGAAHTRTTETGSRASRASVRRSRWRRSGAYRRARRQACGVASGTWRCAAAAGGHAAAPRKNHSNHKGVVPHPSRNVSHSLVSQDF